MKKLIIKITTIIIAFLLVANPAAAIDTKVSAFPIFINQTALKEPVTIKDSHEKFYPIKNMAIYSLKSSKPEIQVSGETFIWAKGEFKSNGQYRVIQEAEKQVLFYPVNKDNQNEIVVYVRNPHFLDKNKRFISE